MAWVLKSESTGLGDVLVEGGMCFSKVTGGGEDPLFSILPPTNFTVISDKGKN